MINRISVREDVMFIVKIDFAAAGKVAPLVAEFRVTLDSYRGIVSEPDIKEGKEELIEFLDSGYPVFAAEEDGEYIGYIVCRIDEPCLWVEHIYVRDDARRRGVASALFAKAEEIAKSMGEDTVFNYVHPNNEGMIDFLRSKGYTVLNMIEIRKPYKDEKPTTTIKVENNVFDY